MLKEFKHIHYALQRVPTLVMQRFAYDLLEERAIGLYREQVCVIIAIEKNSKCYSSYVCTQRHWIYMYRCV